MSIVTDLEAIFVRDAAAISGINHALPHEPATLPKRLPAVTMLYTAPEPIDAETGPGQDVTHTWIIRLYVAFSGNPVTAQTTLKQLLPDLCAIPRHNPRMDDLADFSRIDNDGASEPVFDEKDGWAVKQLRLFVRTTER